MCVAASPAISNLSPITSAVNTQANTTVTATVTGNPPPQVSLYSVTPAGDQIKISSQSHPRIELLNSEGQVSIIFSFVRRADNGTYRIVAENQLPPAAVETFSLAVSGKHASCDWECR